jgi:subtilisin family serine protease
MGLLVDKSIKPAGYYDNLQSNVNNAINYATEKGAIIIAASGNNRMNFQENGNVFLRVFADFEPVLPINACGPIGWVFDPENANFYQLASYSNHGRASEFCAPGGQVKRNFPNAEENCTFGGIIDPTPCWYLDRIISTGANGTWYWTTGTSMAAPHASGVAALIISENPCKFKGKPSWVRAEMRTRAVDKGDPGRDGIFGYGFVQSG